MKNISVFTLDINAKVSWPNPRAVSGIKITYVLASSCRHGFPLRIGDYSPHCPFLCVA